MLNLSEINLNLITCEQRILFKHEDFNTWEISATEEWDIYPDDVRACVSEGDGSEIEEQYFSAIVSLKEYGYNYAKSTGGTIASAVAQCLWELDLIDE